jgi:hypothetical protein
VVFSSPKDYRAKIVLIVTAVNNEGHPRRITATESIMPPQMKPETKKNTSEPFEEMASSGTQPKRNGDRRLQFIFNPLAQLHRPP